VLQIEASTFFLHSIFLWQKMAPQKCFLGKQWSIMWFCFNCRVFEKNGVKLVVDNVSYDFVKGSTVDYVEELIRSAFVVSFWTPFVSPIYLNLENYLKPPKCLLHCGFVGCHVIWRMIPLAPFWASSWHVWCLLHNYV
jgi:hypothetical protein